MSLFKTHGPFKPGLKRFKSQNGNDCLAFYPVNINEDTTEIDAYRYPHKHIANIKKSPYAWQIPVSRWNSRKVNGLVLDGQIHRVFERKQKKLIPIVFCHGLMTNSEEYYGVCM